MTWQNYYHISDKKIWQGRSDTPQGACIFQNIKILDLDSSIAPVTQPLNFAFLGFSCEEGIRRNLGRLGASEAPSVLKAAIATLPLHRSVNCFDAGNITCKNNDLESAQQALAHAVSCLLKGGYTPIILGGGHEVAWGHFQGISQHYPEKQLGIVNFDSHYDMRPLLAGDQGSSGTPFLQIANHYKEIAQIFHYYCIGIQKIGNIQPLFDIAKEHAVVSMCADELQHKGYEKCHQLMQKIIKNNEKIYLSICLDVFSSAYAPGVSAPQPLGLSPWQVLPHIRELAKSSKVVSYDIAELSPPHDIDNRTAKLAAALIYEIIHYHKD